MKVLDIWRDFTSVYEWNNNAKKPIVINQGGTYSGKTIAILQVLINKAITEPDVIITVTSQDLPNLKRDALREFKNLISGESISPFFQNTTLELGPYKLYNGSVIEFVCFQNAKDAEGAKRSYLYVSEAPGLSWDIFFELKKRTEKQIFIDYNPTAEFWAHTELMHLPETQVFISTFLDNKFCTEKKREEIFNLYKKWNETNDEYWLNQWRVYGQGKTGIVSGAVFPNIRRIDKFPDTYYLKTTNSGVSYMYGIDFGYTSDPTAIGKIGIRSENGRIISHEVFYETGVNSFDLPELFPTLGITKNDWLVCDSANLQAIDLYARKGYNVIAAKKDPGSVKAGIELINKHGLDITYSSSNFLFEQRNYVYRKKEGKYDKNLPIDAHNHGFDLTRYVAAYMIYGWGELRGKIKKPQNKRSAYAY